MKERGNYWESPQPRQTLPRDTLELLRFEAELRKQPLPDYGTLALYILTLIGTSSSGATNKKN